MATRPPVGESQKFRNTVCEIILFTIMLEIFVPFLAGSIGDAVIIVFFCYAAAVFNMVWKYWAEKKTSQILVELKTTVEEIGSSSEEVDVAIPASVYRGAEPALRALNTSGQVIINRERLVFVPVTGKHQQLSSKIDYSANIDEGLQIPGSFMVALDEVSEASAQRRTAGMSAQIQKAGGIPYLKVRSNHNQSSEQDYCITPWAVGYQLQGQMVDLLVKAITLWKGADQAGISPSFQV